MIEYGFDKEGGFVVRTTDKTFAVLTTESTALIGSRRALCWRGEPGYPYMDIKDLTNPDDRMKDLTAHICNKAIENPRYVAIRPVTTFEVTPE